jgi:medium-chain acyl-[acyl-carrier-protein] hydrolase
MKIRVRDKISQAKNNRWFYIPRPLKNPDARILFFPYAGTGGEIFHSWIRGLHGNLELYSLQYPGRGKRVNEPAITRIPKLTREIAQVIAPLMDKPMVFFGHCMGGLILFELAQYLRRIRQKLPVFLFLSGARAPQSPLLYPDMHNLPDDEFISVIKKLNLRNEAFFNDEILVENTISILKKDFELVETWNYMPKSLTPLPIPMCAFGGDEDRYVHREHIENWRFYTDEEFTSHFFSGGHFFLHDEVIKGKILSIINRKLKSWCDA